MTSVKKIKVENIKKEAESLKVGDKIYIQFE